MGSHSGGGVAKRHSHVGKHRADAQPATRPPRSSAPSNSAAMQDAMSSIPHTLDHFHPSGK